MSSLVTNVVILDYYIGFFGRSQSDSQELII